MKNKKILLLILFVLILLTGCGKGTVKNERLDIPDSISFSQLEKLAIKKPEILSNASLDREDEQNNK